MPIFKEGAILNISGNTYKVNRGKTTTSSCDKCSFHLTSLCGKVGFVLNIHTACKELIGTNGYFKKINIKGGV